MVNKMVVTYEYQYFSSSVKTSKEISYSSKIFL